jgi:hypothetical protein
MKPGPQEWRRLDLSGEATRAISLHPWTAPAKYSPAILLHGEALGQFRYVVPA